MSTYRVQYRRPIFKTIAERAEVAQQEVDEPETRLSMQDLDLLLELVLSAHRRAKTSSMLCDAHIIDQSHRCWKVSWFPGKYGPNGSYTCLRSST